MLALIQGIILCMRALTLFCLCTLYINSVVSICLVNSVNERDLDLLNSLAKDPSFV
jgi:hypothetical protein